MRQHRAGRFLYVLGHDKIPALHERARLGRDPQRQAAAHADAGLEFHLGPRGGDDLEDVVQHGVLDEDLADERLHLVDVGLGHNRVERDGIIAEARTAENFQLVAGLWVAHLQPHQEAVHLALRQRKRALVVHRILRGDDHEGRTDRVRLAVHRDLGAVHDLQERGLGLGRGAVDLVGQHDVGENRPGLEDKLLERLIVDRDAGHIGGQQVAGELDAGERAVHRAGERVGQRGLADTR